MITFLNFLDSNKLKYNKKLFQEDEMYRAKIINQHLRKFKVYCNKQPTIDNDLKVYEKEVYDYEVKIGKRHNWEM